VKRPDTKRSDRKKLALQITLDVHWRDVTTAILDYVSGRRPSIALSSDASPPDALQDPAQNTGKLAIQQTGDQQLPAST